MEDFDVKEFHSVSAPSVQCVNGISWSEDHKVSFITTSALHIMEVAPNPSVTSADMCLKKSIIKPSDDAPTANAGIDVNHLLYRLDRRDVYRMLLDMKLAPNLPDAKSPEARFISAQWSPISMYEDHRCMIAALTGAGSLKLYVPYFNFWVEVADVSRCWVNHCQSQWTESVDAHKDVAETFATLQIRTSQLKITGMVWGDLVVEPGNKRFSYMATISHSGTIAVWKLDNLTSLDTQTQNYEPIILTTSETNLHNVSAIHWMPWNKEKVSIIVGDMYGCVKIVTFSFNSSENTISILYTKDIWYEKDKMRVSCIKHLPLNPNGNGDQRILAVTKNSYILVFLITQQDVLFYCHDHIGGLPITGLEVLNDQTFVICTLSGCFSKYSADVSQSNENYKLHISSKILTTNLSWQDVACFGMAKTQNNSMWTLCTNLSKMYDHLVVRRPSHLVFINMCGSEDSSKQSITMQSMLVSSELRCHWENLEVFRLNYLKQLKAQPTRNPEFCQDLESLSTTQLQMELWRARIVVNYLTTTDVVVRNADACAYVTLLEELILCRHACKHICTLVERHKIIPLDETRLRTLGLLRSWLQTWLSHNRSVKNEKNNVNKNMTPDSSESLTSNATNTINEIEMENSDNTQMSGPSNTSSSVADTCEHNIDNDAASVGSFDDAISTDSNSSSAVSDKTIVSKKFHVQYGRVPSSFLKYKLSETHEQVTSVMALPVVPGTIDKELCAFCEQEVQMDIDWRSGTCSLNHRRSRCCQCLSQCHHIPYRLCSVCPAVACLNIDHDLKPFCTFCDSPLIVDDKFKRAEFILPQTEKEVQVENEKESVSVKAENDMGLSEVSMEIDT